MRTTLDLPEDLVNEAKAMLGYKSKTDTIVFALKELVRRKKIEDLIGMFGKVKFDLDADELRGKPRRHDRPVE
jgi:Arc/MetJ family transcription regulator